MKHERRRLKEEAEELSDELNALAHLKRMVERNLEEALASLQQERDHRHALKRELDQRVPAESAFSLASLAGLTDRRDGPLGVAAESPALKRIEASFTSPSNGSDSGDQDSVGDLFSEVHLGEIRRMEQAVEQSETESDKLRRALNDQQVALAEARRDANTQRDKVVDMTGRLAALAVAEEASAASAVEEEVAKLQGQLAEYEDALGVLREEMRAGALASGVTQDELVKVAEQLAQVYHLLCEVNGETPNRVMLEHVQGRRAPRVTRHGKAGKAKGAKEEGKSTGNAAGDGEKGAAGNGEKGAKGDGEKGSKGDGEKGAKGDGEKGAKGDGEKGTAGEREEKSAEKSEESDRDSSDRERSPLKESVRGGDPTDCRRLTDTLHDQIKYLRRAVEKTINRRRQDAAGGAAGDMTELQETVLKLKAMLSTKREQIATLRSVLKANKCTAEVALANLKQKYENEKVIVTETMARLRYELKALKEDAVTFASLRAVFAERCDEYATQIDELHRQMVAAEEEKRTLNSLLRMAIQQKLVQTQRLEDMEIDRERRQFRAQRGGRGGRGGGGGGNKVSYRGGGGGASGAGGGQWRGTAGRLADDRAPSPRAQHAAPSQRARPPRRDY